MEHSDCRMCQLPMNSTNITKIQLCVKFWLKFILFPNHNSIVHTHTYLARALRRIVQCTMNIFCSKSGHLNISENCKVFFIFPKIFDYFSEFCSTFCTLHFEKSANTEKSLEKMKKNLSNILLLKRPLLEPKIFTVHWATKVYF